MKTKRRQDHRDHCESQKPWSAPDRSQNPEAYGCGFQARQSIRGNRAHKKMISARRKIGIIDAASIGRGAPIFIGTLEPVLVMQLSRVSDAEARKIYLDVILPCAKLES